MQSTGIIIPIAASSNSLLHRRQTVFISSVVFLAGALTDPRMPSTIIYNFKTNQMTPRIQTLLMAVSFMAFFQSASLQGFAQSDKYAPAMEKTLALFGTAKTNDDYQSMAAAFI